MSKRCYGNVRSLTLLSLTTLILSAWLASAGAQPNPGASATMNTVNATLGGGAAPPAATPKVDPYAPQPKQPAAQAAGANAPGAKVDPYAPEKKQPAAPQPGPQAAPQQGNASAQAAKPVPIEIEVEEVSKPDFTYRRHKGPITALMMNHEGTYCVSASIDKTAQVWKLLDEQTGQFSGNLEFSFTERISEDESVKPIRGHREGITAIDTDSEWSCLLTASYDKTVLKWQDPKKSPRRYSGAADRLWSVKLDPTGSVVAAACNDGLIYFWHADTAKPAGKGKFDTGQGALYDLAFTPDGERLLTAGGDGKIKVLRQSAVERESKQKTKKKSAASEDDEEDLSVKDDEPPVSELTGHKKAVFTVCPSQDGGYLLSSSADKTARLWNLSSQEEICRFVGHTGAVRCAIFLTDNAVITASDDSTVRVWLIPDEAAAVGLSTQPRAQTTPSQLSPMGPDMGDPDVTMGPQGVMGPQGTGMGPGTQRGFGPSGLRGSADGDDEEDFSKEAKAAFSDDDNDGSRSNGRAKSKKSDKRVPHGIEVIRFETDSPAFALAACPMFVAAGCKSGKVLVWEMNETLQGKLVLPTQTQMPGGPGGFIPTSPGQMPTDPDYIPPDPAEQFIPTGPGPVPTGPGPVPPDKNVPAEPSADSMS